MEIISLRVKSDICIRKSITMLSCFKSEATPTYLL